MTLWKRRQEKVPKLIRNIPMIQRSTRAPNFSRFCPLIEHINRTKPIFSSDGIQTNMSTATQTPTPSHGLNPPSFPLSRSRTSSLQNRVRPLNIASQVTESPDKDGATLSTGDIFEKSGLISSEGGTLKNLEDLDSPNAVPEGFDDLPVELVSLLDRFIDSLSAKVYNTPPSIEKLSDIFQGKSCSFHS